MPGTAQGRVRCRSRGRTGDAGGSGGAGWVGMPVPVWGEAGGGPRAEGMPWAIWGRREARSRGGGVAGNGWMPVLGYLP